MNADKLAEQIVKEIGGKNNIKEMFHCVTRLRFYLKDRSVVDEERIKKLDGVLGVQFATDQLQIIIGNEVSNVYNAIINKVGFIMDDATQEKKKKMRIGGIFETISAIIADEAAVGMVNSKTTAVRIIPVEGKDVGDMVELGGLLGSAPVMPVHEAASTDFIARGGRIPAPLQSLKN